MSKRKSAKPVRAPKAEPLDVGKAHADLAQALELHRESDVIVADALKLQAVRRAGVTEAQKIFDAAVEQVRAAAAPFDTAWWNEGRRG